MKQIIFVNSHPIQYFAPLYQFLNRNGLKVKAWYSSDESIKGSTDKQFGVKVKWDIPLLEGYEYHFFKNYSWKPSHYNGFFGLMNLGVVRQLFNEPKSVIVVHGWHYFTHTLVLLLAKLKGHTVCFRCEMPYIQENKKRGFKNTLRRAALKYVLFPRINYFLNIGEQNRLFYKSFDIEDDRIIFCPYSVDNDRFREEAAKLDLNQIRQIHHIPAGEKVIIYSGKYISKKKPVDLINAYIKLNRTDCWLIMIGEGELRKEMEALIAEHQLTKVILTGFVNQSQIADYYAMGDLFVMCSTVGETWGLSINEAMNFNLPVVVSDLTGSAYDLVKEGVNGYVFKTGDVNELTEKIDAVLSGKLSWQNSSQQIVDRYSYRTILEQLRPLTQ
ncbi:glycosyltransferase family 4 protein [Mucilaginibacter sp. RS28]|uniref:Glycosyltransferase family 4 protein n=1 Tax=Mucilaginibacter straminoryzae TaxID=2932774 RepID=A0A9X1X399_9SPHI|nr:glycosyltransferase family 4 protein [Mucilaginibacter straminoryzae]MCJ8210233.1 glycosyltransferase family 4 protein [Mucilaginibacter straminoryzae]